MLRTATSALSTLLVLPVSYLSSGVEGACYSRDGSLMAYWEPCNSTDEIGFCCSSEDFCLSNGLCLGGQFDQGWSVQGCTDRAWRVPCVDWCERFPPTNDLLFIDLCDRKANQYCCGGGCCNDEEPLMFKRPIATSIWRPEVRVTIPEGTSWDAGDPEKTSSGTETGPETITTTTATTTPENTESCPPPGQDPTPNRVVLSVGLGVGAPLALALAVMSFLLWRQRARGEPERAGSGLAAAADGQQEGAKTAGSPPPPQNQDTSRGPIPELSGNAVPGPSDDNDVISRVG
ncbi:hypothetical protein F4775DRAFT_589796 [Biscogniauxia sp. FL1348]|nr:hypothetical protein F4775DRAFT_589796 [Biscogniauxia sp. FL1348]